MIHNPCKGCTNRYVGCHGTCTEYKAFKDELERAKNAIRPNEENEVFRYWRGLDKVLKKPNKRK